MTDRNLEEYAAGFPSMGGTLNGALLRGLAARTPAGTAIVEVGTWLGAGAAQLALGLAGRADPPAIHCFDMFEASPPEVEQAREFGVTLAPGQDTSGHVRDALAPFGVPVVIHKGDFTRVAWDGGPIGVFVDDGTKSGRAVPPGAAGLRPALDPGQHGHRADGLSLLAAAAAPAGPARCGPSRSSWRRTRRIRAVERRTPGGARPRRFRYRGRSTSAGWRRSTPAPALRALPTGSGAGLAAARPPR